MATITQGPLALDRTLRLLIVDDTAADATLIIACLKRTGCAISFDVVELPAPYQDRLQRADYDLVISDRNLRSWTGLDALEVLQQSGKDVPFLSVAGNVGDETAVEYMKRVADYVHKHHLNLLPQAIVQGLREKAHCDEEARLHARILDGKTEWELTFDSVPDAMLIMDDQCRVQRANRAASETLALPFARLIGQPCYEVLHGLAQAPPGCPHEQLLRTGTAQREDYEESRLGKTFDVTSTPLRDSNGTFRGCIHVMRDISDRKRAEQALRHSMERHRSLIAATSQVVWSTDSSGAVVDDLPTWREFTGKSAEETWGRGWLDAVHPDDRKRVREAWLNAVESLSPYNVEFRILRKDGEYRDFAARGVPVLETDGTIREWVGTCTDITDQRQLEEQYRQAQKMEAVGRLAGGVSHDFNNLLGVIIGYSDLLLGSLPPDGLLRNKVEQIKKAGYRAASLTRQMLVFSRKQVLTPKVLDLNDVVSETSKMLIRVLGEDIELITNLNPALGYVKADLTQIDQVIMNLAINASDAMPNGGKLFIETTNVELDQEYNRQHHMEVQPGSYVLLTLSDTGIGMDKHTQAHMFEPFFTTKDVGKGTGLGLATVYGIIKQSGGYVRVYSEVGKGTTFKVYMPRVKDMLRPVQSEASTHRPPASGTILLVEDEDSLRELSHQLLESMGYRVIEAANGADAIRIAGQCADPIQLLMTDVVMPGMSGLELVERMADSRSQMKVLYVSGHTDDVIVRHSILKPGVAFLQKPFSRDALANRIQEVLAAPSGKSGKYLRASG
jgi:PAS domain S-box-containing protein